MNKSYRSIVALHGQFAKFVEQFHRQLDAYETLWISDSNNSEVTTTPFGKAALKLGQEVDVVIFDVTKTLAVNALGAICGCIRGGGALVLVLPEKDHDYESSLFYQRLLQILANHEVRFQSVDTYSLGSVDKLVLKPAPNHKKTIATADQQATIAAIKKVLTGHRNRPLVITSNRGRGKSSAIGIAIRILLSESSLKIIICAPTKAMIAPLIEFAGKQENLYFIAADKLVAELPNAGLVVIDEAGAIPVPLLSKLLQHYSRIVFSTTLHGYEGNGRGFAIRFNNELNQYTPDWRSITLHDPIRWGSNDPLESLIDDLLLLDAEPTDLMSLPLSPDNKPYYKQLSASDLLSKETLLRQLFGLLVVAHYQTRPSDLVHILDDPKISIHAILSGGDLIATAIVSDEGGLSSKLANAVFKGERRPKGHLVPQILLSQMGLLEASTLTTKRIMRIATHPACRRQQLASQLLEHIASRSTADYLSTSFGLSQDLLSFWNKAHYTAVYLGMKREASSGYHSVVMLQALSAEGQQLQQVAQASFIQNFVAQLGDTLNDYNPAIAFKLLSNDRKVNIGLSPQEIRDIDRFANGQCGLESALAALQHWLPKALTHDKQTINSNEAKLLIML